MNSEEIIEQEIEVLESIYQEEMKIEGKRLFFRVKPNTGQEEDKVGVYIDTIFNFSERYPIEIPTIEILKSRGLEEEMLQDIQQRIKQIAKEKANDESYQDSGYMYDLIEASKEILSEYNDTIKGRCSICLEDFAIGNDDDKFTERTDLARVDECYHRFHLLCLYRDWFIDRQSEKDEFGNVKEFKAAEDKACPVCRKSVTQEEAQVIKNKREARQDLKDGDGGDNNNGLFTQSKEHNPLID